MAKKDDVYKQTQGLYDNLTPEGQHYMASIMAIAQNNQDVFQKGLQRRDNMHSGKPFVQIDNLPVDEAVFAHSLADAEVDSHVKPKELDHVNSYLEKNDVIHELAHNKLYKRFSDMNFMKVPHKDPISHVDYHQDVTPIQSAGHLYNSLSIAGKRYFDENARIAKYSKGAFSKLKGATNIAKLSPTQQRIRGELDSFGVSMPTAERKRVDKYFDDPRTLNSIKHETFNNSLHTSELDDTKQRLHQVEDEDPDRYQQVITQGMGLYQHLSPTGKKYMMANIKSANQDISQYRTLRTADPQQLTGYNLNQYQRLDDMAKGQTRSRTDGHAIPQFDPMSSTEKDTVDSYLDDSAFQEGMANGDVYNSMYRQIQRERNLAETREDDDGLQDPFSKYGGVTPSWIKRDEQEHPFFYKMGYLHAGHEIKKAIKRSNKGPSKTAKVLNKARQKFNKSHKNKHETPEQRHDRINGMFSAKFNKRMEKLDRKSHDRGGQER